MTRTSLDDSVTILVRGMVLAGLLWLIVTATETRERVALVEYRLKMLEAKLP